MERVSHPDKEAPMLSDRKESRTHCKNRSSPEFCSPKEVAQHRYCRGKQSSGRSYLAELDNKENCRKLAGLVNRIEVDLSGLESASQKNPLRLKKSMEGHEELQQFSMASINYSLALINKTLVEYCMANALATSALRGLDKKLKDDLATLSAFRNQLIDKINTEIDSVLSKMKEDEKAHRQILKELAQKTAEGHSTLLSLKSQIAKFYEDRASPIKAFRPEVYQSLDSIKNQVYILSVELETHKTRQAKQICLEEVRTNTDLLIDKVMTGLFEEMKLSDCQTPALLVAQEALRANLPLPEPKPVPSVVVSRVSSRDSRCEPNPKRGISEKLKQILKQVSLDRGETKGQSSHSSSATSLFKLPGLQSTRTQTHYEQSLN